MHRLLTVSFLACFVIMLYSPASGALDPAPPDNPVRLIFIHHSTGENWLNDSNGKLGIALRDNNYFVSDTNYGWGAIGNYTDIGNWWDWFRGPGSGDYLAALYAEGEQHCSYSRLSSTPAGENEIVMFKSCFPNSALQGSVSDAVPAINLNPLRGQDSYSQYHTVANAKGIYIDLLEYFRTRPDKLFVVIAAPPLSDSTYASNARAFNNWLVSEWLTGYPLNNVAVFDFYNVLTGPNNHHRWTNNTIEHQIGSASNTLYYPSAPGDDHPNTTGNLKATAEYLPLLNIFYNCWKNTARLNKGQTYPTISEAFAAGAANTENEIELIASAKAETVDLHDPAKTTLRGGFDCGFTIQHTYTTINGSVTVSKGTLIMDRVVIL